MFSPERGHLDNVAAAKPEVAAAMKKRMAEYDASCLLSRDGADYQY